MQERKHAPFMRSLLITPFLVLIHRGEWPETLAWLGTGQPKGNSPSMPSHHCWETGSQRKGERSSFSSLQAMRLLLSFPPPITPTDLQVRLRSVLSKHAGCGVQCILYAYERGWLGICSRRFRPVLSCSSLVCWLTAQHLFTTAWRCCCCYHGCSLLGLKGNCWAGRKKKKEGEKGREGF